MINNLWFGMSLTEAVSRPRLIQVFKSMKVFYEEGFPEVITLNLNTYLCIGNTDEMQLSAQTQNSAQLK